MNIKDSILTGFGAGYIAVKGPEALATTAGRDERLYREDEPEFALTGGDSATCLFYLGADSPYNGIFYEFVSSKFIEAARDLRMAGKSVYVLTRNMVAPSLARSM